uniref:Uncharacterized protein n=1 Tax=Romanomermis culicivorax TaxID=13658 RepID=A0A915IBM2_ROMCU
MNELGSFLGDDLKDEKSISIKCQQGKCARPVEKVGSHLYVKTVAHTKSSAPDAKIQPQKTLPSKV